MENGSFNVSRRPSLPVTLSYRDFQLFVRMLDWSLEHSAAMAQAYRRLLVMARSDQEAESLATMLREEHAHLELFVSMYRELRGDSPEIRPEPVRFRTYLEGLTAAAEREKTAIKRYRDTYLLTPSPRIRDVFFAALCDELDHTASLGVMKPAAETGAL